MINLFIDSAVGLKNPFKLDDFNSPIFDLDYSEIEKGYRYKKVIKNKGTKYIEIGLVDKNKENHKIEHRQKSKNGEVSVLVTYEKAGCLKIKEISYSLLKEEGKSYRSKKISILEDGKIREYDSFGRHKVIKIYDSNHNLLEIKLWDTGKKGDEFKELLDYKI